MKMLRMLSAVAMLFILAAPVVGGTIEWHDPVLNWDFNNLTCGPVNDLSIIVDNPNQLFNPNLNDPGQVWAFPFQTVQRFDGDFDGDGDSDTKIKYSNPFANIPCFLVDPVNGWAHGGLDMTGSGRVLDAYWTLNCNKVGASIPITYEKTEIRADPEVHMHLEIADGFFDDPLNYGLEAGWTEIRTFVNLPYDLLDLPDLNRDLDLSTLAAFEVTPEYGQPGLPGTGGVPILPSDVMLQGMPAESFFDVYLADIPPEFASPQYESLLVATIVGPDPQNPDGNIMYGQFWNLNPQSPEPATLGLLAFGSLAALLRRRRR